MISSGEAVEAAAKMYDAIAYGANWELLNDYQRESRRRDVTLILEAAAQPLMAQAWDEGRESFAEDLLRPLSEIGTRESSTNPYRTTK